MRLRSTLTSLFAAALLAGCSLLPPGPDAPVSRRVSALLPTDVLIVGEQHDAPEHHVIERETVEALVERGRLAALLLEMAEDGQNTAHLSATASEAQVKVALGWNDREWPWTDYGPAIMAAVRAGVTVAGANLPRARMKDAMADVSLDVQLNAKAFAAQQDAVREGHCRLLPEAQIVPMTRIQVGRDRAMAQAIVKARQPGKTVLLITGAGHAVRSRGVAQHLPDDVKLRTVNLVAGPAPSDVGAGDFDGTWQTPSMPAKDYCAELRQPPPRPR